MTTDVKHQPGRGAARKVLAVLGLLLASSEVLAQTTLSPAVRQRMTSGGLVRVIVTTRPGHNAAAEAPRHGARLRRQLTTEMAALEVDAAELGSFAAGAAVAHVAIDLPVRSTAAPATADDTTAAAIGADQVWSRSGRAPGYTGRGVGVAVIDSGVHFHPALLPRIVASVDFTGTGAGDGYGHGTHIAGAIAGQGTLDHRRYPGIAPGAHIVSLKVLDAQGAGRTSDVMAALEWVVRYGRSYGIRIVNLSIGHPVVESHRDDPLNRAVQRTVAAGFVVVASAGNAGHSPDGKLQYGSILSPANDPAVITVGAVDTRATTFRADDLIADFSARGPTLVDGFVKPDLVAPGRRITAAASPGSYLATTFPDRLVPGISARAPYLTLSGTSMAAAVVSGTVALMLEAKPALQPAAVKAALEFSAEFHPDWYVLAAGAGSLNAAGAVEAARLMPTSVARAARPLRLGASLAHLTNRTTVIAGTTISWGNGLTWNDDRGSGGIAWLNGWRAPADVIWGNGLVWSNALVWSNGLVWSNALVWSNSLDANGDGLVWSNGAYELDGLVWSNGAPDGDALVWSNALAGR